MEKQIHDNVQRLQLALENADALQERITSSPVSKRPKRARQTTTFTVTDELHGDVRFKVFLELYFAVKNSHTDQEAKAECRFLIERAERNNEEIYNPVLFRDSYNKFEYPLHMVCSKGFLETLKSCFVPKMKKSSDCKNPPWQGLIKLVDEHGQGPLFYLFGRENDDNDDNDKFFMERRCEMMNELISCGAALSSKDKKGKTIFHYLSERGKHNQIENIIRSVAGRFTLLKKGRKSIRQQEKESLVDRIKAVGNLIHCDGIVDKNGNMVGKDGKEKPGIWKGFGTDCQIYFFRSDAGDECKRPWRAWKCNILCSSNNVAVIGGTQRVLNVIGGTQRVLSGTGQGKRVSKRFSLKHGMTLASKLLGPNNNNLLEFEFINADSDETIDPKKNIQLLFKNRYREKIKEELVDKGASVQHFLKVLKLRDIIVLYYECQRTRLFDFHKYMKTKENLKTNDFFLFHSFRIYVAHVEMAYMMQQRDGKKNVITGVLADIIFHNVLGAKHDHNHESFSSTSLLLEAKNSASDASESLVKKDITGYYTVRELRKINEKTKLVVEYLKQHFHQNGDRLRTTQTRLDNVILELTLSDINEEIRNLILDKNIMHNFRLFATKHFVRGPHVAETMVRDREENTNTFHVNAVFGKYESYGVMCPIMRQSEKNDTRKSLQDTASYFVTEIIASALDANCDMSVIECVRDLMGGDKDIDRAIRMGHRGSGQCSIIELLRKCPIVEQQNRIVQPALHKVFVELLKAACKYPDETVATKTISLLLEKKLDMKQIENEQGFFPLAYSLQGHERYMKLAAVLVIGGATVKIETLESLFSEYKKNRFYISQNKKTLEQEIENLKCLLHTILLYGAMHGTLAEDVLIYMVDQVATLNDVAFDINYRDKTGGSAMHYAAMYGHDHVLDLLIRNRASVKYGVVKDSKCHRTVMSKHKHFLGYSPLGLAVQNGHLSCVKVLLDSGADPFDGGKLSFHNEDPTNPVWLALGCNVEIRTYGSVLWADDKKSKCQDCDKPFNLVTRRRHHCRFCGRLLCHECSSKQIFGIRACKNCDINYNNVLDTREYYWKAHRSLFTRMHVTNGHSQSTYRSPLLHGQHNIEEDVYSGMHSNILLLIDMACKRELYDPFEIALEQNSMSPVPRREQFWFEGKEVLRKINNTEFATYGSMRQRQASVLRHWLSFTKIREKREEIIANKNAKKKRRESEIVHKLIRRHSSYSKDTARKVEVATMLKKAKTDKAERLKGINRLFRTNPKVSEMRKKYGVDSFYNYSMHTLLFFLLGFCSFQYFSNLNRSSNTMPKLVDRKLSGCASFAAVNLRKSETFFDWLQLGLFNGTLSPLMQSSFYLVGPVSVMQNRKYVQQGYAPNGHLSERMAMNSKSFPDLFRTNVNKKPWGKKGQEVEPPFVPSLNEYGRDYHRAWLSVSEAKNDIQFLKNNSYIDKYTAQLIVNFVVYSNDLQIYTRARIIFHESLPSLTENRVFYDSFSTDVFFAKDFTFLAIWVIFVVYVCFETYGTLARFYKKVRIVKQTTDNAMKLYIAQEPNKDPQKEKKENCFEKYYRYSKDFNLFGMPILHDVYLATCLVNLIYFLFVKESLGGRLRDSIVPFEPESIHPHHISVKDRATFYAITYELIESTKMSHMFVVLFIAVFTIVWMDELKSHPRYGKFVIAIGKTISSSKVKTFMLLWIMLIIMFSLMFLSSEHNLDWYQPLIGLVKLFTFAVEGPEASDYRGGDITLLILYLVFMILISLFFANLLIAILTDLWDIAMKEDLWDDHIDTKLQEDAQEILAGRSPARTYIMKLFYRARYTDAFAQEEYNTEKNTKHYGKNSRCFSTKIIVNIFFGSISISLLCMVWFVLAEVFQYEWSHEDSW